MSRRPSRASRRSSACTAPVRRASARTSPTTPPTTRFSRPRGRSCRSPASGRSASFCDHVEALDLWPAPARSARPRASTACGRYESTALDLALRQAGTSLHAAVGREPRPLRFVVSLRLGEPPTLEPVSQAPRALPGAALQARPDHRLDARAHRGPRGDGRRRLGRLQGPLRRLDRRPARRSRPLPPRRRRLPRRLDRGPRADRGDRRDPRSRTATASPGTRRSTASRTSRPCPSRRGWSTSSRRAWGRCARCSAPTSTARRAASGCTAAGSSSSGPGRGHIQYLASVFHPDTPNDVAPGGYNEPDVPAGLPDSPLEPVAHATGFRWG